MSIETRAIAQTDASSVESSHLMPVVLAALLGFSIIFLAGFAETSVFHNATHDSRHSAGFPCH